MLRWLRVEVRSSLAPEEEMEFTSDANALGVDAGISFIVERFCQIHLDGGTQAFSSVCWTRVYESLRAFTCVYVRLRAFVSVYGLSEL